MHAREENVVCCRRSGPLSTCASFVWENADLSAAATCQLRRLFTHRSTAVRPNQRPLTNASQTCCGATQVNEIRVSDRAANGQAMVRVAWECAHETRYLVTMRGTDSRRGEFIWPQTASHPRPRQSTSSPTAAVRRVYRRRDPDRAQTAPTGDCPRTGPAAVVQELPRFSFALAS